MSSLDPTFEDLGASVGRMIRQHAELKEQRDELLAACMAVQEAIKDSIRNRTSMNSIKYDAVGQQLVKAIQKPEIGRMEPPGLVQRIVSILTA